MRKDLRSASWGHFRTGVAQFLPRLLPNIGYGTEGYEPKVARRLRALNISAWCTAALGMIFAGIIFLDTTPGAWRPASTNLVGSVALAALPFLHRFGPQAAPAGFTIVAYAYIFIVCRQIGTGTGMQMEFLAVAAGTILFLGTDRRFLISVFSVLAVLFIVALEILVPRNTGLFPATMLFTNFMLGVPATCAILLGVVYYAVREATRAEAAAEYEYARSESLLANILPASIAARLKRRTGEVIADRYDSASILFADMAEFTARSADVDPNELVVFLNHVFTAFDRLVERHGLEKIKTTGDSYMVVAGLPTARPDHAGALALFALDMIAAATRFRDPRGRSVPFRIGIASGPVVAGVVGTSKFFYDVWGDTVNFAARMETTGEPGKIQITQETYNQLRTSFCVEPRGAVEVKGKGLVHTWFLGPPKEPSIAAGLPRASD